LSTKYVPIEERIAFGQVLRRWFKANDWPQDVPHRVAAFTGAAGPWNSQVSTLMSGKLDPKPALFVALGAFNQFVAEQHLQGVTERRLVDQLKDAQPLCHDNGRPYTAPDFFALFVGLLEPPSMFAPRLEITDGEAKDRSDRQREIFQGHAKDLMLSPKEAWDQVRSCAQGMSAAQLERFKEVLSGWGDWTGQELMAMDGGGDRSEADHALVRWTTNR
jgi:hypothetical protein